MTKNKKQVLYIKVTDTFKDDIKVIADEKGLDMSNYIRMILTEKINESKANDKGV